MVTFRYESFDKLLNYIKENSVDNKFYIEDVEEFIKKQKEINQEPHSCLGTRDMTGTCFVCGEKNKI